MVDKMVSQTMLRTGIADHLRTNVPSWYISSVRLSHVPFERS